MAHDYAQDADLVRQRLGPVGTFMGSLLFEPMAVEEETVRAIEELGYGAFWFGEIPGKEALSHAAILLAASERIVVASSIANIWARDATSMVGAAGTLDDTWPGRFVLGIGISHAPMIGPRGHDYTKPYSYMKQYLDAMDEAPTAAPITGDKVPRLIGALRMRMMGLARDRSAGAIPYFVPVEHTAIARETLGPDRFLAPAQAVVVETDPVIARAAARVYTTPVLEFPNYSNNLRDLGYGDEDFADGGSDRLVDAIVAWGDVEAVAGRIRAHHEAGADHVSIMPLASTNDEAIGQLRELAPALVGAGAH